MAGNTTTNNNRTPRGPTHTNEELTHLINTLREVAPIGGMEWERVHEIHSTRFPGRTIDSLRRKFYQLANKVMPTGDANCPTVVREAKDIMREITLKCELEVLLVMMKRLQILQIL